MVEKHPPTNTPKKPRLNSSGKNFVLSQVSVIQSPYFSPTKSQQLVIYDADNPSEFSRTTAKNNGDNNRFNERTSGSPNPDDSDSNTMFRLTTYLGTLKPNLIQEQVADDPWKLLIAVTLLNKTTGKLAIPIFYEIIQRWPTPFDLSRANEKELAALINVLGTQNIRSKRLIALSKAYIQDPPSLYDIRCSNKISKPRWRYSRFFASPSNGYRKYPGSPVSHYPGSGPYALDSYRIFSRDDPDSEEWKTVIPTDKELIRFLKWKWAFVEGMKWSPTKGVVGTITEEYLTMLIVELEMNNVTKI